MDKEKQERLEKAGWTVGTLQDFLNFLGDDPDATIKYKKEVDKLCPEGWRVLTCFELVTFGDRVWDSGSEEFEPTNLGDYCVGDKADRVICAIRRKYESS